jgi:hypothetical protein
MAYDEFFSNELVERIFDDLEKDQIHLDRTLSENDLHNYKEIVYKREIRCFNLSCGKDEDYLLEVLKNDYKDFYTFLHHRLVEHKGDSFFAVCQDLAFFALIKHFPESLEKFVSLKYKTYKKTVKLIMTDYNNAFGIA